jgi:hypothetical protein
MSAKEVFSRADVQWLVEIAAELEPKDVSPPAAAFVVAKCRRVMKRAEDGNGRVEFQIQFSKDDPLWTRA